MVRFAYPVLTPWQPHQIEISYVFGERNTCVPVQQPSQQLLLGGADRVGLG